MRGDLSFIEKALGVAKARSIYEEQFERKVTQQELADLLTGEGYRVTQSNISRMEYGHAPFPSLIFAVLYGVESDASAPVNQSLQRGGKGLEGAVSGKRCTPVSPIV